MTCGPAPGILKVIVSGPGLLFASAIACRREPEPLSFVLVTVKALAEAGDASNATGKSESEIEMKIKKLDLMNVGRDNRIEETQNLTHNNLGCIHMLLLLAADDSHYPQRQPLTHRPSLGEINHL